MAGEPGGRCRLRFAMNEAEPPAPSRVPLTTNHPAQVDVRSSRAPRAKGRVSPGRSGFLLSVGIEQQPPPHTHTHTGTPLHVTVAPRKSLRLLFLISLLSLSLPFKQPFLSCKMRHDRERGRQRDGACAPDASVFPWKRPGSSQWPRVSTAKTCFSGCAAVVRACAA